MEFHPRIMRLLKDPERFKCVPLGELKNIITSFKDYPTLKYDFAECHDFEDITNEVNIYEAFESRSRLTRKHACVPCTARGELKRTTMNLMVIQAGTSFFLPFAQI